MKAKLKNIHTSNHHTMRKIAVALMILFSLMVIPNSIGQNPTPTAAISLDCDEDNVTISYFYEENFDYNPNISDLNCNLHNPTVYQEKVEITVNTGTEQIIAGYPTELLVNADSSISFSISYFIYESLLYEHDNDLPNLSVNTLVSEINGFPPTNNAENNVSNVTLDVHQYFQSNTLYAWGDGNQSFWSNFSNDEVGASEYYYSEVNDGVIDIQQKYAMNQSLDKNLTVSVGSQIYGNFDVYYEGDSDSTDNAGPCTPDYTPSDCDWLNITLYSDDNLLHRHTEGPWPSGQWKNIQFSFLAEDENMLISNDGGINLSIEVTMKIKGDYQESFIFASGTPGEYRFSNGGHIEFPFNGFANLDSDGDGVDDDNDDFPNDANETQDSDGDGVGDNSDEFPNDANETQDSDGDGVGDNSDEFPQDGNETHDDDGDGVGNNTDAFPQDGNETHDDDGDGVGNNTDAFPQDANETMDTDGDGVGDNADPEPEDPTISSPADIEVNVSDTSAYLIAGSVVFLALVIIFVRRRPPSNQVDDKYGNFAYQDSLFNED